MKYVPGLRWSLGATLQAGVVDRHHFDADPDPTYHFVADPDPDPVHTSSFTHVFGKSVFLLILFTAVPVDDFLSSLSAS